MTLRSNILPQSYTQKVTAVVTQKRPLAWIGPQRHILQWPPGKKTPDLPQDRRTLLTHRVPLSVKVKIKVKESRNSAGVAQRVPGGLGSQIPWHSARKGGEVVSLTHRPPLPPGMFMVLIFTRGWVDSRATVRSEGNVTEKSSDTTGNRSWDRPTSSAAP
jgi:hypothetical protein